MAWGYQTATHSQGSAGTATGTILAANASRRYALFVNDSDSTIYVALGGAASLNTGIRLNPNGGNYEMALGIGNVYTGAVQAITASGTKVVTITEGVS